MGKWSHGEAKRKQHTKEYDIWVNMIQRCYNESSTFYYRYGGRGIRVCDRWLEYVNFLEDMGRCPARLTLERIDNDIGYCPWNCKWDTRKRQANNRSNSIMLTVNGETRTVAEWAALLGIDPKTIYARCKKGWTDKECISPVAVNKSSRLRNG